MVIGKSDPARMIQRDWFLLAFALLALSVSTLVWVNHNQAPPSWDPADHVRAAYEYYQPLYNLDLTGFIYEFFYASRHYAPFYHLLVALLFFISPPGLFTAVIANLLLLGMAMAAIYLLGRHYYSTEAGLLAALLLPAYHINAALVHEAFLDFALMCWVGLSLLILVRAGDFRNRRASLILGVILGLGMLCKQTYLFFMALPVIYSIVLPFWRGGRTTRINIALMLAAATLLTAIWYIPHWQDVIEIYRINRAASISEGEPPVLSYLSNLAYVNALASAQIQMPFFGIFLIGLAISLYRYRRESMPLYLCLVGGLVAFTFIANKDIRYTMPFLPAIALLSVCWLGHLRILTVRILSITLLLVLAIANFWQAQWPAEGEGLYYHTKNFRWAIWSRNYLNYDQRPSREDWAFPAILQLIGERAGTRIEAIQVGMAPNLVHFNPSALALLSKLWNYRGGRPRISTAWLLGPQDWPLVARCNYIILRARAAPEEHFGEFESQLNDWIQSHPEQFVKVGEFPLVSLDTHALIYEQVNDVEQVHLLGSNAGKSLGVDAGVDPDAHLFCDNVLPFRLPGH
ncbi:MAG: glycosyltransferase family 39 protein [Acidobacteriota bacterium]